MIHSWKLRSPFQKREGTRRAAFPPWSRLTAKRDDVLQCPVWKAHACSFTDPACEQNKAGSLCWPRLVLSTQLPLREAQEWELAAQAPSRGRLKSCWGERTLKFYLPTFSIIFFFLCLILTVSFTFRIQFFWKTMKGFSPWQGWGWRDFSGTPHVVQCFSMWRGTPGLFLVSSGLRRGLL